MTTLVGRTQSRLAETATQIEALGHDPALVAVADVRIAAEVDRAFTAAAQRAPVNLLVTSAGINRPGPLCDLAPEQIEEMLDINVLGTLLACRAFGRQADGGPRAVVCVSSQMGSVGYPDRVSYCASKHAVNGAVKALALEWAPRGIRVNAVSPTFLETPFTERMFADPAFRDEILRRIPLGRLGTLAEVSSAILYLLSEEASLITGHSLATDGGWTAI